MANGGWADLPVERALGTRTPPPTISLRPPRISPVRRATPDGACSVRGESTNPVNGWVSCSLSASWRSWLRLGSGSGSQGGGVRIGVSGVKSKTADAEVDRSHPVDHRVVDLGEYRREIVLHPLDQ